MQDFSRWIRDNINVVETTGNWIILLAVAVAVIFTIVVAVFKFMKGDLKAGLMQVLYAIIVAIIGGLGYIGFRAFVDRMAPTDVFGSADGVENAIAYGKAYLSTRA